MKINVRHLLVVIGVVFGCLFLSGCNGEQLRFTFIDAEAGRVNPALPAAQTESEQNPDGSISKKTTTGAVEKTYHDPSGRLARD